MPSAYSAEALAGLDLLRNFSARELADVLAACSDVEFAEGQTIFREGDLDRALFVLVEGTVNIGLEEPESLLVELSPVSVFGESSFFHPAPHTVTAWCETPVRVVKLGRSEFDLLAKDNAATAWHLGANAADILGGRLQATDRFIAELLQSQQDARVHSRWREFRERLGHSFSAIRGGLGPGAGGP
jgi:CRP-like cAMP-binding protein